MSIKINRSDTEHHHDHITAIMNELTLAASVTTGHIEDSGANIQISLIIGQPDNLSVLLSDYTPTPITTGCPSQHTTQCSPAMLSAPRICLSQQRHLSTPSDDTSRLIYSPSSLPLTNKPYHQHLRFDTNAAY